MDFSQALGIISTLVGIMAGVVAVLGFILPSPSPNLQKQSTRNRFLLISGILAVVLIGAGLLTLIPQRGNQSGASGQSSSTTPASPDTQTSSPHTGSLLYNADWSKNMNEWQGDQQWKIVGGLLVNDGTYDPKSASIVSPYIPQTANYAVEAQIQALDPESSLSGSGSGYLGIFARADFAMSLDYHLPSGYNFSIHSWINSSDSSASTCYNQHLSDYALDTSWHTYRIELKDNTIKCFIDGKLLAQLLDNSYLSPGKVGLVDDSLQIDVRSFKVFAL